MGTQIMTTVTVDWDDELENSIVWRFERQWQVVDYYNAMERNNDLAHSHNTRIDVIVDMPSFYMPSNNIYSLVRHGVRQRDPNLGMVVFITSSMFWHRVYEIVSSLFEQFSIKLVFATTLEEARTIIRQDRAASRTE